MGRARPRRGRRGAARRPAGPVHAAVHPRPARNRHRPSPLHPAGRPAAARRAPYRRPYVPSGPYAPGLPAVDRDAVIARLADEIRDAIAAGDRWQPDYPALMQATGRRRSWCEKAVRDARTAVFNTPDDGSLS